MPYLVINLSLFAQSNYWNPESLWSANKIELKMGLGASQFLGDVGGASGAGTDYSLKDIDWGSTGTALELGWRIRPLPRFAVSVNLMTGMLHGSDKYSNDIVRHARNISFKTPIFLTYSSTEIILWSKELKKNGIRHSRRNPFFNYQLNAGIGLGVCYFDPKGCYNGQWYRLRPLKTEGQGSVIKNYSPVTPIIPFSLTFRWSVSAFWRMGVEFNYFVTFTDYMDDTHGKYVTPDILNSDIAIKLANPATVHQDWFFPGQQRGDKQNDSFYTAKILLIRNITYKR